MDPNMISQLLGGGGVPVPDASQMPQAPDPQESQATQSDTMRMLDQALDKMANIGIPFVGDIAHLLLTGGSQQSWDSLLKTIDSYGKHKNSLVADKIPKGPTQENPTPPGSYGQ